MTLVALRALGLGDLLTAVPALRALARAFPHHRRLLGAPAALAPLARLTGAVDGVTDMASLGPLALDGSLDIAVNLHGRGPESHRVLLAGRPGRLIAFAHPDVAESAGGPAWRVREHEVTRWCRLLDEAGIPADPRELDLVRPAVRVEAWTHGATLIHSGAGAPARCWPAARWVRVARAEADAGRRVLVTAGAGEATLALRIAREAGLGDDAVRAGVPILVLAALVAAAGRVVVGDTGVAHLATALGTPSVVLFGPSSPADWGPPPERRQHHVLWAGRLGDPHGARPDAGLLAITVDDVLAALERTGTRQPVGPAA
jgi:ADP-heptose:LPS heptosyltransferase